MGILGERPKFEFVGTFEEFQEKLSEQFYDDFKTPQALEFFIGAARLRMEGLSEDIKIDVESGFTKNKELALHGVAQLIRYLVMICTDYGIPLQEVMHDALMHMRKVD